MFSRSNTRILYVAAFLTLLSTTLFLALSPRNVSGDSGEQWLTGWQYRKSHVINGSETTAGTNYPVKIDVYYLNYTSLGTVTTKTPMPTGLSDLPGVTYDSKIYTFGGYAANSGDSRNSTYCYDPATNTWTTKTSMTYARWGPAAAVYNGIAYVFGGSPSYVEAYNFSTNSWTTKNGLPGPISTQGLMAVTVGDNIYLFCYQYCYRYDPSTDTYTALTNLPTGYSLTWGTCAYVNVGGEDRIYIIGGYNYAVGGGGSNQVIYYRLAYNDWIQPSTTAPYAAYGTTRDNPVINGKIYYGYGNSQTSAFFYSLMYAYDPSTGSWTQLTSGVYPRDGMANGIVDGKLYVIGGRDVEGGPYGVNYNECFDVTQQNPINDNGQTVTANMKCRTDFGDIRFTASDGATQLNYWMQSSNVGVMATFWIKIPDNLSGNSATIYMYYGNPSAITTSNGAGVWTLFDNFEGANPLSNYNAEIGSNSSFTIAALGSNHVLSYIGPVAWFLFSRTTPTFQNMRILATMMPRVSSGNYYTGLSFRETGPANWYFVWLAGPAGSAYAGSLNVPRVDWLKRVTTDTCIASVQTADMRSTWATVQVDMADSSCKTYVNGVKKMDATDTALTLAGKIGFIGLYASYWDDFCVGSYVNPEPAHGSWGPEEQEPSNPTLTVNIVGSGVVDLNNSGPYNNGDVVQLAAVPTIGWSFDHWSGNLTGSANPATITMTGSMTVTATFTQNTYTLTVSEVGNGSVNLNNTGPYHYNDAVQLTAVPDTDWIFRFWSGEITGSANPNTLTITGDSSVTANFGYPTLVVSPSLVERDLGDVDTAFSVNVEIENVKDLWGFDFRLDWDDSLLTFSTVDYNSSLDTVWGNGQWFVATDINDSSFYQLAAVSLKDGFNSTELQTLATLTFRVEDPHSNFPLETLIKFTVHKLSDSKWQQMAHTFEDSVYRMTEATKPSLALIPTAKTCRKYAETFTVKIDASNAFNLTDFEFEVDFNTTLLDYSSITWNAWGTGNVIVDEVNGKIIASTTGSSLDGNLTLATIEFKAAYHRIWKSLPSWVNEQTGKVQIEAANMSYQNGQKLQYVKDGLDEINVASEFACTFSPIKGDIDNDGTVDIVDLRTTAAYYDQENPTYNLTGDSVIDIFDLVVIGSNFGYTYVP